MVVDSNIVSAVMGFMLGLMLYLIKVYRDIIKELYYIREKVVKIEGAVDILMRAFNDKRER